MRFAFLLYRYHPFGGVQRDFRGLVEELTARGHYCRMYCISWQGEVLPGAELRLVPVKAIREHQLHQRFYNWVRTDLARETVDGVIGFAPMPGLDVLYTDNSCCQQESTRGWARLFPHSAGRRLVRDWEAAALSPDSGTEILFISPLEQKKVEKHYGTALQHLHQLPPGVSPERRAPKDAAERRKVMRASLGLVAQELTLLFVGSDFVEKGLEQAITTLAHMREEQPSVKSRLLVAGLGKTRHFKRVAKRLGVATAVEFLGGREDIADLMLGADLLVHPTAGDAADIVVLEALAAGLPVVTTDLCGYAHHVKAARAGILLLASYSQEQLDRAVMRYIDGTFRAECRQSALLYARLTDLYSMPRIGADRIEKLIGEKREHGDA
jgi:UDP-glucose:(heptosyl)LPS alpha-1,3-glucosyltransferase